MFEKDHLSSIGFYLLIWSAVTFFVTATLFQHAPHFGHATELSISASLYHDLNKVRDLAILPFITALALLGFWISLSINRQRFPTSNLSPPQSLDYQLEFLSRFALIACACIGVLMGFLPAQILGALGLGVLILTWKRADHWRENSEIALIAAIAFTIVLSQIYLWPIGASFALGFLIVCLIIALGPKNNAIAHTFQFLAAVVIGGSFLLTAPFLWRSNDIIAGPTSLDWLTFIFVGAMVIATARTIFSNGFRAERLTGPNNVLTAATLGLLSSADFVSGPLTTDDYHFGEALTAFRAALENRLFVDLLPAHGLEDAIPGLIATLANDQSAAGVLWGSQYAEFAVRIILFYLLLKILPDRLTAIFLCILIPTLKLGIILPITSAVAIIATTYIRNNLLAGTIATLLSASAIFASGGMGVVAAVFGYSVSSLHRYKANNLSAFFAFVASSALFAIIFILANWIPTLNWIEYLIISTRTNATIYGAGMFGWPDPHYLFLITPFFACGLVLIYKPTLSTDRNSILFYSILVAPIILLGLLINSYAFARIDALPGRAARASVFLAIALPIWAFVFIKGSAGRLAAAASGFALMLPLQGAPVSTQLFYREAISSKMQPALQREKPVNNETAPGFRIGNAVVPQSHLQNIMNMSGVLNREMEPGDPFGNLTNRSALHFYLDRQSAKPITSAYNSAPEQFQRDTIQLWDQTRPKIFVVSSFNQEHDGYSLPLRSNLLFRYLVEYYSPFTEDGIVYGRRKSISAGASNTNQQTRVWMIPHHSDVNWQGGIAIGENARTWSFFIPPESANSVETGDTLLFNDGISRKVLKIDGVNVRIEDPQLSPSEAPWSFEVVGKRISDRDMWKQTFPLRDFEKLPAAWGRSERNLENKLTPTKTTVLLNGFNDLATLEGDSPNSFRSTGGDPYFTFDFGQPVDPKRYGILRLDTNCDTTNEPEAQVFWRSERQSFSEVNSVRFHLSHNILLIPLDATPHWLLSDPIVELRIDVGDEAAKCNRVYLESIELLQRKLPESLVAGYSP